jgi:hypothetical protein
MKCDDVGPVLLEDGALRTPEMTAHLSSCAQCRGVLLADERARELSRSDRVPPLPAAAWSPPAWRGSARFALTAAGLVAVGALAALPWVAKRGGAASPDSLERALPVTVGARTETEPLRAAGDPPAGAEGADDESLIDDLIAQSAAYVGREVSVRDSLYAPFGDLPRWVSLPANRSLDAPVFRKALYPIHNELNPEVQQ